MPRRYSDRRIFRVVSHPNGEYEVIFRCNEEEAQRLAIIDQTQITCSETMEIQAIFDMIKKKPADNNLLERRFEVAVQTGPAVHDTETSQAAKPTRRRWTQNLAYAWRIIVNAGENGITDEQAGFQFAKMRGRPVLDIGSSWRPTRGTLVEKRLVRDSGRKRELRSGNEGIVWVANDLNWQPPELNSYIEDPPEEEE